MTKGFVFGKFLPFHLGHQALIEFGASNCDELTILVCASFNESLDGSIRAQWISETFRDHTKIKIITYQYDESILPNSSVSSKDISKRWAREFIKLVPDSNVLFTSEPYGDFVAEYMGIKHILFDQERNKHSISGSSLRTSTYDHWKFLPDPVKPHFQKKVVLLGTESVGKSTLANQLSRQFKSSLVDELGREIIPVSNHFTIDQLRLIAEGQVANIRNAKDELNPLIIIDTDVHITQSYAKHTFGQYLDLPDEIYMQSRADLYLYLNPDVPYVQDGTRLDEDKRNALDLSHRETLQHFGITYTELTGSFDERNKRAIQLVKGLLNSFY